MMSTRNLFAYDSQGNVIVTVDGTELLVHSGDDGEPLWRSTLKSKILGVGTTPDEVVTLDQRGRLVWRDARTGDRNDQVTLEGEEFLALAVDPDGIAAVLVDGKLELIEPDEDAREVALGRAQVVAWSSDGGLLAVGSQDGKVWVLDQEDLQVDPPVEVGGEVTGIAWNANGCWLFTAGNSVYELDEAGQTHKLLARVDGAGLGPIASSEDGSVFALRNTDHTVEAFSWPAVEAIGSVRYQDRPIAGLAFGPRYWLGVGLDLGDGNKINLRTESVHRTRTFEGREHSSWMLSVSVRGAESRRKKSKRTATAVTSPKPRLPSTEAELNAPDWQAISMLGIITVMTIVMWSMAYAGCNAHPPESKKAKSVTTEELAAKPKDAAIEMIQRWTSHDLAGAAELAKGPVLDELQQAEQQCKANKSACDARKKELEGQVVTMAEVLNRDNNTTHVRVTTRAGSSEPQHYLVDVVPDGAIYKVVGRTRQN